MESLAVTVSHRDVLACAEGKRRRHRTSIDWVWQMMKQVRRWPAGRWLVLVVDGGFAAVLLALPCIKQ